MEALIAQRQRLDLPRSLRVVGLWSDSTWRHSKNAVGIGELVMTNSGAYHRTLGTCIMVFEI